MPFASKVTSMPSSRRASACAPSQNVQVRRVVDVAHGVRCGVVGRLLPPTYGKLRSISSSVFGSGPAVVNRKAPSAEATGGATTGARPRRASLPPTPPTRIHRRSSSRTRSLRERDGMVTTRGGRAPAAARRGGRATRQSSLQFAARVRSATSAVRATAPLAAPLVALACGFLLLVRRSAPCCSATCRGLRNTPPLPPPPHRPSASSPARSPGPTSGARRRPEPPRAAAAADRTSCTRGAAALRAARSAAARRCYNCRRARRGCRSRRRRRRRPARCCACCRPARCCASRTTR